MSRYRRGRWATSAGLDALPMSVVDRKVALALSEDKR